MRRSLLSLIESIDYPTELTVVDNGQDQVDSEFLLNLAHAGKINTYIRNANNMHFGWSRNQGIQIANGDYFCIVDNDLVYEKGWLSKCVAILDENPDKKIYSTPVGYPTSGFKRYKMGFIKFEGVDCELNMRAGSNCFVVRREDMKKIGRFYAHKIAGTKWTDRAVKAGYLAVIIPGKVLDVGLRTGYNFNDKLPIKLNLISGPSIFFNQDNGLPEGELNYEQRVF